MLINRGLLIITLLIKNVTRVFSHGDAKTQCFTVKLRDTVSLWQEWV